MTDHDPSAPAPGEHLRPDDDLVSSVVDGEASPDDLARVAADPTLAARADEFRAVAVEVGADPGLPSDDERASALAAALGALPAAPPDELAPRRARRRTRLPSPVWAAAAVALLIAVGIGLILGDRGGRDREADLAAEAPTTTTVAAPSAAAAEEGAADRTTAGDAHTATTAAPSVAKGAAQAPGLGSFATQEELTRALATLDLQTLRPPTSGSGAPATTVPPAPGASGSPASDGAARLDTAAVGRCDTALRSIPGTNLGDLRAVTDASLEGRTVYIFSHPRTDATGGTAPLGQLSVVDAETCQVLFAVQR